MTITELPAPSADRGAAEALFKEAHQRRRKRRLVGGLITALVLGLGLFFVGGGGGHLFGGPPTSKSPAAGGAAAQQSSPQSHGQRTSIRARPSACNEGILPGKLSVTPADTVASASLLPCYTPTTVKVRLP